MLIAKLSSWLRSATSKCSLEMYALRVRFATLPAIISISLTRGVSSTTLEGMPDLFSWLRTSLIISLSTLYELSNFLDLLSTFVSAYKMCSVPTSLPYFVANWLAT